MAGPALCLNQDHRDPVVTADTLLSLSRRVSWAVGLVLCFLQAESINSWWPPGGATLQGTVLSSEKVLRLSLELNQAQKIAPAGVCECVSLLVLALRG